MPFTFPLFCVRLARCLQRSLCGFRVVVAAGVCCLVPIGCSPRPSEPAAAPQTTEQPAPLSVSESSDAVTLPVLCYHVIEDEPKSVWSLSTEHFKAHIGYLAENGYRTVSLEDVTLWLDGDGRLPQKSVLITFDDWDKSHYEIAFPILKRAGFTGTFNIISSRAADARSIARLKEMIDHGCSIASHSISHKSLIGMKPSLLQNELQQSKADLESRLAVEISYFCYPYGFYDKAVIGAIEDAGYRGAFITVPGVNSRNTEHCELRRLLIQKDWDVGYLDHLLARDPVLFRAFYNHQAQQFLNSRMYHIVEVIIGELEALEPDAAAASKWRDRLDKARNKSGG